MHSSETQESVVRRIAAELACGRPWDECLSAYGVAEADYLAHCLRFSISTEAFHDPAIDLVGTIFGQAPVQAEGQLVGQAFYFRGRHGAWTFTIAPPDQQVEDDWLADGATGLIRTQSGWDYHATGAVDGLGPAASYLQRGDVERIIRQQAGDFLHAKELQQTETP